MGHRRNEATPVNSKAETDVYLLNIKNCISESRTIQSMTLKKFNASLELDLCLYRQMSSQGLSFTLFFIQVVKIYPALTSRLKLSGGPWVGLNG